MHLARFTLYTSSLGLHTNYWRHLQFSRYMKVPVIINKGFTKMDISELFTIDSKFKGYK